MDVRITGRIVSYLKMSGFIFIVTVVLLLVVEEVDGGKVVLGVMASENE